MTLGEVSFTRDEDHIDIQSKTEAFPPCGLEGDHNSRSMSQEIPLPYNELKETYKKEESKGTDCK